MTADELTDAAKKEIAEAIRIIREDKFERYVRERLGKAEAPTPPVDKPTPDAPTPPPPVPPENPPTPDDMPKKRGLYWGDAAE